MDDEGCQSRAQALSQGGGSGSGSTSTWKRSFFMEAEAVKTKSMVAEVEVVETKSIEVEADTLGWMTLYLRKIGYVQNLHERI